MKKKHHTRYNISKLEWLVAINGGAVLVLEIIGSRIMAPYFGTSIYVWTAIIGVILFSLSVGYWYGGKLADKSASESGLAVIFLFAGLILAIELLFIDNILEYFASSGLPLRLSALLSALFIYTLPTTIMGVVSPYVSKLAIKDLSHTGETIGRLFAAGTLGSIAGTFLAGYWLTGTFTNESINASIVVVFLGLSLLADWRLFRQKLFLFLALVMLVATGYASSTELAESVVYQQDTAYARYRVVDRQFNARDARLLLTDRLSVQSAEYLDAPNEPAIDYIDNFMKIAESYAKQQEPTSFLIIGGGAYSLPKLLAQEYPEAQIDIVEIDGELLNIARNYFGYELTMNSTNYVQDGRIYLNESQKTYDIVFLDAFSSFQPPFHLSTVESFAQVKRLLKPGALMAVNVIGSESGPRADYTSSIQKTAGSVFETLLLKATESNKSRLQNVMVVATSDSYDASESFGMEDLETVNVNNKGIVLTDSFAPVDKLTN